jgi:glycosyltransferase involved in cell wall biosynthesis
MTVTLFIPTKNEIEAMRVIMPQIDRSWVDQILVVDGSTDGTAEYAESIGLRRGPPARKGPPRGLVEGFAKSPVRPRHHLQHPTAFPRSKPSRA